MSEKVGLKCHPCIRDRAGVVILRLDGIAKNRLGIPVTFTDLLAGFDFSFRKHLPPKLQ